MPAPRPLQDSSRHTAVAVRSLMLTLAVAGGLLVPALRSDLPTTALYAPSALLVIAAVVHRRTSVLSRAVATTALLGWSALWVVGNTDAPGSGFVLSIAVVGLIAALWPPDRPGRRRPLPTGSWRRRDETAAAAVAAAVGLAAWRSAPDLPTAVLLGMSVLFVLPGVCEIGRLRASGPVRRAVVLCALGAGAVPALAAVVPWLEQAVLLGLLAPLLVLTASAGEALLGERAPLLPHGDATLVDVLLAHPPRVLVVSFAVICACGTVALSLPSAVSGPGELGWLDAAFTAVSATCVTGLIVVDTPVVFSGFGEFVLLALIQIGGLGIMVVSAAAFVLLGRRLSLSHESAAASLLGAPDRAGLAAATRQVLIVTFATEAACAVLLCCAFVVGGEAFGPALWRAVFTAVSAFCNAGFALQSDSLVPYAEHPFVLLVIAATITIGGLGPAVIASFVVRSSRRPSLHVRLVLWTSLALVVVPALLITVLEWGGTLGSMGAGHRIVNGLFQSITLRTAGFNSIDLAAVEPATWTVMVLVMFVGGSPGSTAGGVKTTTFAIIVLAIASVVRGRDHVEVFGRTLSASTVLRASAVATAGVLAGVAGLVALQLTQTLPLDVALFEVVSALATVGLSTGGTGQLDDIGQLVIMVCMFAGRVGPLTLFFFLSPARNAVSAPRLPEESVPIG